MTARASGDTLRRPSAVRLLVTQRWRIIDTCFTLWHKPGLPPCGRFLFWSKTKTFVQTFVAALRYFWTLEDTLAGYMFNDLLWCGQEDNDGRKTHYSTSGMLLMFKLTRI
ncbi:ADP-ribosyl cyclase/cyclic ADP-ribose hydrolase 1 [Takifugu flavidus]|uniref:ADP-ribosyl cyclase/cyclic ADP-ribose hydrolase n=1 Tax=Takifugu flavidus TaxID=433684 RepID=A0A5C6MMM8_9TELE|nr:ADP-ribosyl cyclase/cyclic ADP-ribose hydrolase 1 [Takifugu flavidus]